jgi:hypothetical protein
VFLLKRRQTKCQPSPKSFREVMSCSRRKAVTEKLVGKGAMVSLGCLAELAEKPLRTPKLLSVVNPPERPQMVSFTDPNRLVVPVVTVGSTYNVSPSTLMRF